MQNEITPGSLPYATYHVLEATAKMPASCWGRYMRFAVIEVRPGGSLPLIIRDTKTATVVETWEKCHDGRTRRCAADRARTAAEERAAELQEAARLEYVGMVLS